MLYCFSFVKIWLKNCMRMLNCKTLTHTNKEKINIICEYLLENLENIKLQWAKPSKNWYLSLSKYHGLWNFLELPLSTIFIIFKLLSIIISLSCCWCYILTLQVLACFEGNNNQNEKTIWSCATSPWHPLNKARWKSKLDCVIQLNCRQVRTYASYETTSHIREFLPPKSVKNGSTVRWTMTDYICSSSYFVVSLQSEFFFYKTGMFQMKYHWVV